MVFRKRSQSKINSIAEMKSSANKILGILLIATLPVVSTLLAADAVSPASVPLKMAVETKGPVRAPEPLKEKVPTSGKGFWKFIAARDLVQVPEEAKPFIKGAHGTVIFDADRDTIYWGLEKVGWVGFGNHLTKSWVVQGDAAFKAGGLHGADILKRRGKLPVIAVADNVRGEVYITDTSFQHAEHLDWPAGGPYKAKGEYHPTDVAFVGNGKLFVTDGYGKAFFMPFTAEPLKFSGEFFGGKDMSKTPHGITYNPSDKTLLISARPEGLMKKWSIAKKEFTAVDALPAGAVLCDIDLWDEYALAPCLDGPDRTAGPIYIVNNKTKSVVATIRPKEDLGFTDAQHIHDACWYFAKNGRRTDVYIIFTNWNPGGIGAMKLVNVAD